MSRLHGSISIEAPKFLATGLLVVLGIVLSSAPVSSACSVEKPNILLIIMDDTGIEHLEGYNIQDPLIRYPDAEFFLEEARFRWLTFTNAWSNPICSPTRGTILTGQYGSNTGVGDLVGSGDEETWGLDPANVALFLPQRLSAAGYHTGAFGKWHMGTADGPTGVCPECKDQGGDDAPGVTGGFDHFHGFLLDKQDPLLNGMFYDNHFDTVNGVTSGPNFTYLTDDITDWAVLWINEKQAEPEPDPWFAYVAHRAPHAPFHCPPSLTPPCDVGDSATLKYQYMIETLDNEIEDLLNRISFDPTETLLIIVSDNGSPEAVNLLPTKDGLVKGTVGQGGVRVPMFFGGCLAPLLGGGTVADIVGLSDLFATILEVATGADPIPGDEDSQSLAQYLDSITGTPVRDMVYTEVFFPNFDPDPVGADPGHGPCRGTQAARDADWKFVRRFDQSEAFFDMNMDPWEDTNMIDDPNQDIQTKIQEFRDYTRLLQTGREFFGVQAAL